MSKEAYISSINIFVNEKHHFVQQGDICPSYGTDSTCIRSFSVAQTLTGVGNSVQRFEHVCTRHTPMYTWKEG